MGCVQRGIWSLFKLPLPTTKYSREILLNPTLFAKCYPCAVPLPYAEHRAGRTVFLGINSRDGTAPSYCWSLAIVLWSVEHSLLKFFATTECLPIRCLPLRFILAGL